jgi:hypothetical protein
MKSSAARVCIALLSGLAGCVLSLGGVFQTNMDWYTCTIPTVGSLSFNLREISITIDGSELPIGSVCDDAISSDGLCTDTRRMIYAGAGAAFLSGLGCLFMLGLFCCNQRNCNWLLNLLFQFVAGSVSGTALFMFWRDLNDVTLVAGGQQFTNEFCSRNSKVFGIVLGGQYKATQLRRKQRASCFGLWIFLTVFAPWNVIQVVCSLSSPPACAACAAAPQLGLPQSLPSTVKPCSIWTKELKACRCVGRTRRRVCMHDPAKVCPRTAIGRSTMMTWNRRGLRGS